MSCTINLKTYRHSSTNSHHYQNFYGAKTVIDGKTFHCNEQYLFYTKADIAGDQVAKKDILNATSTEECKRRGGQINLNIETWKATSCKVMYDGCYAKFKQNPELKKILLDTGDRTLVEASKTDIYIGVQVQASGNTRS